MADRERGLPASEQHAQFAVAHWLDAERAYAEAKWPTQVTDQLAPEEYEPWVCQYIHRAVILGVGNPLGRQAMAKALRTLLALTESVVRKHGELPMAGVPSGEIVWPEKRVP